jgi:hypothetical protein
MKFEELNSKEMVIKIQSYKEFGRVERYLDKVEIKLDKECDFYDKENRVCLKIYGKTACMWGKSFLKTCEVFLLSDIDEFKECRSWTMRCVDDNNQNFIKNKIYKVTDNKLTNELPYTFGIRTALILKSFDAWVEFASSKWELISIDDETEVIKELPQIDLRNRVISIKDDEDIELLFDMLEEQGFVWGFGGEKPREWIRWKTVTRIYITDREIYNASWSDNCKNFSDILKEYEDKKLLEQPKQFTKSDLRDGMVAEYKSKSRRLVLGFKLTGKNGHSELINYTEDLRNRLSGNCDIYKIYKSKNLCGIEDIFNDENLELIWERKEEQPKRVWTEWKKLYTIGGVMIDDTYDFRYRTNGKKVEVKEVINNNNGRASCSDDDEFDLEYGIKLAAARIGLKVANNTLATLLKAKGK